MTVVLGDATGMRRPSPAALLPGCGMARALRATGDTTKQKILTLSSLLDVRMRVCLGSL